MGTRCRVCGHPERARIELALAHKVPLRALAKRWPGTTVNGLWRHRRCHMPAQLMASLVAVGKPTPVDLDQLRKSESEGLLQNLVAQRGRLYAAQESAFAVHDLANVARIEGEIGKNIALTARLLGEISVHHKSVVTNILVAPQYLTLRAALIQALRPHVEARRAVAAVLASVEGSEPVFDGVRSTALQIEGKPC